MKNPRYFIVHDATRVTFLPFLIDAPDPDEPFASSTFVVLESFTNKRKATAYLKKLKRDNK